MASQAAEMLRPARPAVVQPELCLLVELPPRHRVFLENLRDFLLGRTIPPGVYRYPRAAFWQDVFVERGIAWRRMRQSALGHLLFVVAIYGLTTAWITDQRLHPRVQVHRITNYDISEYLPPMEAENEPAPAPRKGEPKLAKQKIVSLRPNPDNHEQTIITPPDVRLPANIPLPNVVAWTSTPGVPSALAARQPSDIKLPNLQTSIIAPAPDPVQRELSQMKINDPAAIIAPPPESYGVHPTQKLDIQANVIEPPPAADLAKLQNRRIDAPTPAVIEPPPDANVARTLGAMNIGQLSATVSAPKFEVAEQQVRLLPGPGSSGVRGGRPPAGSGEPGAPINPVSGAQPSSSDVGQLIALNLNPAVPNGPVSVPPGRRSGEFAAGPEGHPDAPGTPDIKGGGTGRGGDGVSGKSAGHNDTPAGITIGGAPGAPAPGSVVVAGDSKQKIADANKEILLASARPTRVGDIARDTRPSSHLPDSPKVEDRVFGSRKIYTLSLNMPNLVSSGGSWIVRFAEISDDHSGQPLSAPVATSKVDPAYPAELMRNGVEGTVVLYAVIHKDGTVGEVRVLRGLQTKLDENARIALSRWKFRPGMKNGEPVELEAVVQIPFKASRISSF